MQPGSQTCSRKPSVVVRAMVVGAVTLGLIGAVARYAGYVAGAERQTMGLLAEGHEDPPPLNAFHAASRGAFDGAPFGAFIGALVGVVIRGIIAAIHLWKGPAPVEISSSQNPSTSFME